MSLKTENTIFAILAAGSPQERNAASIHKAIGWAAKWAVFAPGLRGETLKESSQRETAFRARVHQLGYGFSRLDAWAQDERKLIDSLHFVGGVTHNHALKLQKQFGLDFVVYLGPETEGQMLRLGEVDAKPFGPLDPDVLAEAFSKDRGTPCLFEWVPRGFWDHVAVHAYHLRVQEQEEK